MKDCGHERDWILVVASFLVMVTVTHLVENLSLRAAYPNDLLNAPELVFESAMMVQTNSIEELNEIEA